MGDESDDAENLSIVSNGNSNEVYSENPSSDTTNCCSNNCQKLYSKFNEIEFSSSNENIIAFFWAAAIFFVGLIFIVAQYTSKLDTMNFRSTYWMLFAFICVSIIGLSLAIRYRNSPDFIDEDDDDDEENDGGTKSKYLIGNAYIFAAGNFLLDMFSIVTVFHCSIGTSKDRDIYVVKSFFHAARIIFTSLQLIFLQIFSTLKVRKGYKLRFKILVVHVVATNFLIWFTFLCQETGILAGKASEDDIGEYHYNCTSNPGDSVYETAKYMSKILQPFILEFSLLSASLLYSICPLKIFSPKDRSGGRRKYNYGAIDTVKRDDSKNYQSDPGLLFGIFTALLLVLSSWSLDDEDHYIYDLRFNYSMQMIVQSIIIFASVIVLWELKKYHDKSRKDRKYCIDDYLLLITGPCGFLPFLFTVFFALSKSVKFPETMTGNISKDMNEHEVEIKVLLGFLSAINMISVFVQTFFLLEAHSYDRVSFAARRRDSSYNYSFDEDEHRRLRSAARIGQWLLLLLVLNLAFWVTDSFFELRNDLERTYGMAVEYWGKKTWGFITKLLYPIIIFYRFHSVAMISHIWLHLRVKKKIL